MYRYPHKKKKKKKKDGRDEAGNMGKRNNLILKRGGPQKGTRELKRASTGKRDKVANNLH